MSAFGTLLLPVPPFSRAPAKCNWVQHIAEGVELPAKGFRDPPEAGNPLGCANLKPEEAAPRGGVAVVAAAAEAAGMG